jgi:hypothetical protein
VRTTGAGQDPVQVSVDEGDVGDAADEGADAGIGLARGDVVGDGGAVTVVIDPRNARADRAAAVRSRAGYDAIRIVRRRLRAAEATFGDV